MSLSVLRAWYAGVDSRQALQRYCPQALERGQSSRGVIGRLRRHIIAFALSRHRDDLAGPVQCGAEERTRDSKAAIRALNTHPGSTFGSYVVTTPRSAQRSCCQAEPRATIRPWSTSKNEA